MRANTAMHMPVIIRAVSYTTAAPISEILKGNVNFLYLAEEGLASKLYEGIPGDHEEVFGM